MIHQNARGSKKDNGKPVNINISFTINPKNILNNPPGENQPIGRRVVKDNDFYAIYGNNAAIANCPKTPDLNAEIKSKQKNLVEPGSRTKRSQKRNSVDETSFRDAKFNDYNKSLTLRKFAQTVHTRKPSTRSKKISEQSYKKHNKTTSNFTRNIDRYASNSVMIDGGAVQNIGNLKKNLKKMINNMVNNELSKRSLPMQFPNSHSTSRKIVQKKKQKKRSPKKGKSQTMLHDTKQHSDWDRQKIIQKLTSFRSMNNSVFISEGDQQIKPRDRRSIIVNTDQSIQCIDQIHEIQVMEKYRNLDKSPKSNGNAKQTIHLIETYVALLNEHIQYEGNVITQSGNDKPIDEEFEQFQKNHQQLIQKQAREEMMKQIESHQHQNQVKKSTNTQKRSQQFVGQQKRRKQDELRPFCSSQMTKQQQLINQLERIKLNELKKHEVEKWQELLVFMKNSMENGQGDSQQILETVYHFLQKTRNDLQNQLDSPKKQSSQIDAFTNKLASNLQKQQSLSQNDENHILKKDNRQLLDNNKMEDLNKHVDFQFDEISSMSFKDEDYQEQNQELKVLNLQMIDTALKNRHKNLLERRQKQIQNLQQKRNSGKITEVNFILEKDKIDKWTKQQTLSINQARKNIWNGYNQAKGILQKSARSKIFQQECESNKKKSMMKCLSQDYLLKKNINIIPITSQQKQRQHQSSSQSEQINQNSVNKIQKNDAAQKSIESDSLVENRIKYQDSGSQNNSQSLRQSSQNEVQQGKQTIQLNQLKNQEDIDVIKQKLLDFKQQKLKQQNYNDQNQIQGQSPNMSYQQVANQLHQSYSDQQMNIIRNQFENHGRLPPSQNQVQQQQIDDSKKDDYQKLKYMCAEDKEDIFQFIFLDLSIQLYQQPCTDNKIMNAINNYVDSVKRQANKKKGVKTNLNVVKQYLRRFSSYLLRTNKEVLLSLDQPVGPTAIQMLRYMHENQDQQPRQQEQPPSTLIIPASVFDEFQKQLLPSIQFEVYYENDQQKENRRVQFLRSVLHIHNKALYDSMNEYLDTLRPFGIWGKPFPWKKASSFLRLTAQQDKQQKLKKSTEKVSQYCSYVCGLLVDKQQSLVGNARLSEDYLQQIKQDRLSRMLATQLMENQERWLFYDDQETEVLVELSNALYRVMVKEAAHQMLNILKEKSFQ